MSLQNLYSLQSDVRNLGLAPATVDKNMAYILGQSFWLSLFDIISVGSHKVCHLLLDTKALDTIVWQQMMSIQVSWWTVRGQIWLWPLTRTSQISPIMSGLMDTCATSQQAPVEALSVHCCLVQNKWDNKHSLGQNNRWFAAFPGFIYWKPVLRGAADKCKTPSLFLPHPPLWQSHKHCSWDLGQRTQPDLSKEDTIVNTFVPFKGAVYDTVTVLFGSLKSAVSVNTKLDSALFTETFGVAETDLY